MFRVLVHNVNFQPSDFKRIDISMHQYVLCILPTGYDTDKFNLGKKKSLSLNNTFRHEQE
jgi:hypothetical protein